MRKKEENLSKGEIRRGSTQKDQLTELEGERTLLLWSLESQTWTGMICELWKNKQKYKITNKERMI